MRSLVLRVTLLLAAGLVRPISVAGPPFGESILPTGKRITPLAAPGSTLQMLNPDLPHLAGYLAGQAISTALSPDGRDLLVLTSGFNRVNGQDGKPIADESNEYVFVYDVAEGTPRKRQVLQVPNSFAGIAFARDGKHFYVSGGKDDNVHSFALNKQHSWVEDGRPIALGHPSGLGLHTGKEPLAAGGIAVTSDNGTLLVANVYNDSVSYVDLKARRVRGELDLRPGKIDRQQAGVPGGEYPFWVVVKGNEKAYVSSIRDREIDVLSLASRPKLIARIKVSGNPNKMVLDRAESRLFVASDNSDLVTVIDAQTDRIVDEIPTTGPSSLLAQERKYTGSGPNSLALSPDEHTLYVTNGGSNSVAVVGLGYGKQRTTLLGLIPTGWFPTAISVSRSGKTLFATNSKSVAGPNPLWHANTKSTQNIKPGPDIVMSPKNQYVLQLEKASLLSIPVPSAAVLERLTRIVADNNRFDSHADARTAELIAALRLRIRHVIYIIKENRTYDQVLGDLGKGNGESSLTEFGAAITPNFHKLARQFVDLDNFFESGEVSGDG